MDENKLPKDPPQTNACCCGATPQVQLEVVSCCRPEPPENHDKGSTPRPDWIVGTVATRIGDVPRVSTVLHLGDRLGSWKMRWAIGRMRYAVEPGLYAVGSPTAESPVVVSANYKMSFDRLRSELAGLSAWVLVLDTRGINVWCAAAKGTFGTEELVRRVEAARLSEVVSHRELIVPQLGAVGVAAHEVKRQCGFHVVFGPVDAADLPDFLANGKRAPAEMRRVRFALRDRLVLAPVELVLSARWMMLAAMFFLLLSGLGRDGYAWTRAITVGGWSALLVLAVGTGSVVFTAALLPWLPGRAFSWKGLWLGLAFLLLALVCGWGCPGLFDGWFSLVAWCLLIPATASFVAVNFTGATTYTSLSGVRKEMRTAVPIQAAAALLGVLLWLAGRWV